MNMQKHNRGHKEKQHTTKKPWEKIFDAIVELDKNVTATHKKTISSKNKK